jgi:4-hydroxy-tetrahydrodipicolinate reductase
MDWELTGLPCARVRLEREDSAHATAANLLNRIPQIIAAPPGIQLVSQLGPMQHSAQ